MKNISRRDIIVFSVSGERRYNLPPKEYRIVNEIMEIIDKQVSISEKLRLLSELHERYLGKFEELRKHPDFTIDQVNEMLLDPGRKEGFSRIKEVNILLR